MKLTDQFDLSADWTDIKELLSGMDCAAEIHNGVSRARADVSRVGDGVDYCIAAACIEAEDYGNGTIGDVLEHLKYQHRQLAILIKNMERLGKE